MKRNLTIANRIKTGLMVLFFFVLQNIAFAGLAVSPLQQDVEVKPGKKTTFFITITNNKRSEQTPPCPVSLNIQDFMVSDKGQLSFGPEYKHPRSAAAWISLEEKDIILKPGESRKIQLTVSAPMNADGDYWAAAMIELGNSDNSEKGVEVKFRTASGIFIRVARRSYTERGSVIDANVSIPEFNSTDNLTDENASKSASMQIGKNQVLEINAELKNDGLVSFLARGKANLYSDGWRRVATIPLYTSRRRVLPGDSRWFTGVMAQPLPAGQYKLRTFFSPDSKYRRKMTKDMEFTITEDIADVWAKNFVPDDTMAMKVEPQEIKLQLNPGRLTTTRFQVLNPGLSTIAVNCRIEGNNDWLELKTTDFTIAPNAQRSITCIVKIPSGAQPGQYDWVIYVEMENSGLASKEQNNTEQRRIPVSLVIDKNIPASADR